MPEVFDVQTRDGNHKQLELQLGNYEDLGLQTDVLVFSAYRGSYKPVRGTLIRTLAKTYGIDAAALARNPWINLKPIGTWMSQELEGMPFKRIACVELRGHHERPASLFENLFFCIAKAANRCHGDGGF